jgi:RNA recognition motif. (a.k.a. RRM, RBD, or RNP domain)
MSSRSPPLEAQRFGRSQTPESPRPIAIPEPSNIPVLQNQMDPIFNDTATYHIRPDSQPSMAFKNSSSDSGEMHYEDLNAKSQALQQSLLNDHAEAERAQNRAESSFDTSNAQISMPQRNDAPLFSTAHNTTIQQSIAQAPQVTSSGLAVLSTQEAPAQVADSSSRSDEDLRPAANGELNGIDYESILASIDAPTADGVPITRSSVPEENANASSAVEKPLPAAVGLPPKPPLPEKPADFADYNMPDSFSSSYYPKPAASATASYNSDVPQIVAKSATNGLPPPPSLRSQQADGSTKQLLTESQAQQAPGFVPHLSETERPWGPEIQTKYDKFLEDERMFVTEGVWDKFPVGSRLFVGNLPTEKVTKRDLFHIFHKYGQLAQISIKQAYGFVQFLLAADCQAALQVEQGVELRDRLLHLEISKPQKNSRNTNAGGNRNALRRRSRSPERAISRMSADRGSYGGRPPYSDYRDEHQRRRDDYRPVRSPSPRGFRSRDEYRNRDDRYDGQARSPQFGSNGFPGSGPQPPLDEDAMLPLPRRALRDVPDVQLLVLEDVGYQIVNFVEQGFRSKGLTAQTTWLSPRLTLAAVVKRQIIEGVQAIVKLTRTTQYSPKIPLQVFDRTPGTTNVNFNEYVNLDVHIAADIVIQARQKERMTGQRPAPSPYPPQHGFPPPQAPLHFHQPPPMPQQYSQIPQPQFPHPQTQIQPAHHPQPPQYGTSQQSPQTPNSAGSNVRGGGSNLQELLANLNRQPSGSQGQPQSTPTQATSDLAGLLQNVAARQQNQTNGAYGQGPAYVLPQQQQPLYGQYQNPPQNQQYGTPAQQPQQNVQNIMDQLARYSR